MNNGETQPIGGGRGRGRGGGVPVLPSGMWDSMNGNTDKVTEEPSFNENKDNKYADREDDNNDTDNRYQNRNKFGNNQHGNEGRGRGKRKDDRKRGGIERDAKGIDWECPSCTNVNWSWRSSCNKCNTSKPAAIVSADEHRDGAGGGFNERQNRASAATVEIDEEGFDDFGRRVKKSKRADRQAKEEAALARLSEKYKHLLPTTTQK